MPTTGGAPGPAWFDMDTKALVVDVTVYNPTLSMVILTHRHLSAATRMREDAPAEHAPLRGDEGLERTTLGWSLQVIAVKLLAEMQLGRKVRRPRASHLSARRLSVALLSCHD